MNLEIQTLEATLTGIVMPKAPMVDRLTLDAGRSSFTSKTFDLKMEKAAKAKALVGQGSLAAFLEREAPGGLKGFKVEIRGGLIYIEASIKVIFDLPVKAQCTLEIKGGSEIHVKLISVDVAGGPAKALVESQIEKQNPILDANDFPFKMTFNRVVLEDGVITLEGEARP